MSERSELHKCNGFPQVVMYSEMHTTGLNKRLKELRKWTMGLRNTGHDTKAKKLRNSETQPVVETEATTLKQ
jgi:hypothetical protein